MSSLFALQKMDYRNPDYKTFKIWKQEVVTSMFCLLKCIFSLQLPLDYTLVWVTFGWRNITIFMTTSKVSIHTSR